jgi:hypothetical protein
VRAQGISHYWDDISSGAATFPATIGLGVSLEPSQSAAPTEPGPVEAGQELSEDDVKAIKVFLREMVVQSIIPWIERSVVVGNEQVRFNYSSRTRV